MAATLTFLKYEKVIQVDSPQTSVTIQDLVNQIRDWEDELTNMDYSKVCDAFGKQDLGGGSFVGITLVLLDGWRLSFEARAGPSTEVMTVSGGNLIGEDELGNQQNPIYPTAYTQVVIAQSSSPTIITPPEDLNMLYLVESLRGNNAALGDIYYWDPANGNDINDGTTPSDAVKTFAAAQALAADGNNDIIFALATDTSGITVVDETINITKDGLKLRGPGYQFQLTPTTSGSDTITIGANNVEVSGFYVTTAAGGTDNGVTVTGTNDLVRDLWIDGVTGNGIDLEASTRATIEKVAVENSTGNGIQFGDSTTRTTVSTSIIDGNVDGIDLTGTGISDNIFENNLIYNNSGWGMDIGANVTRTIVRLHHTFANNTSGDTQDNGTDSYIEAGSTGPTAAQIADAVWDELITDHTTANTTGKTLKDAKTRATLASIT